MFWLRSWVVKKMLSGISLSTTWSDATVRYDMYIPSSWLPDIVDVLTEALKQPENLVKTIEEVVKVKHGNRLYLLMDTYNWVGMGPKGAIPHALTVELVKEAIERANNSPNRFYG